MERKRREGVERKRRESERVRNFIAFFGEDNQWCANAQYIIFIHYLYLVLGHVSDIFLLSHSQGPQLRSQSS